MACLNPVHLLKITKKHRIIRYDYLRYTCEEFQIEQRPAMPCFPTWRVDQLHRKCLTRLGIEEGTILLFHPCDTLRVCRSLIYH